jgi:phenylacetate-CoA ligase
MQAVPAELRRLNPLITPAAAALWRAIQEHPHAPRWNYRTGDWISARDLEALETFRQKVLAPRRRQSTTAPPTKLIQELASVTPRVEWLRQRLPEDVDLEAQWQDLPCMTREDLATDMGSILPDDADLEKVAIYETSGTTGHRLPVPNSARGASSYAVLLELAMQRHGVEPKFSESGVGCFLIGAQQRTVTYATVHAVWSNSGFAKLNLRAGDWPTAESPGRFLEAFDAPVLCGDPVAFDALLTMKPRLHPQAMISTAVSLPPVVQRRLVSTFGCPVIDTYSLNETGLVAYTCPEGVFHLLPPDIHVETLDVAGHAVAQGERGEVAVSGFRNPYLPLLRYRTGDFARLDHGVCGCGDPAPRLLDLEGRAPVLFRAADGSVVNTVDLSQAFRSFPLVQHRFVQHADRSCYAFVRVVAGARGFDEHALTAELRRYLGSVSLSVEVVDKIERGAGDKVVAYESELRLGQEG